MARRRAATDFNGVIDFELATIETYQAGLARVAATLDGKVRDLAAQFTLRDGAFVGDALSLGRLEDLRRQLDQALTESGFPQIAARYLDAYPALQQHVSEAWDGAGIPAAFSSVDTEAFRAIAGAHYQSFANIGEAGMETVKTALMQAVTGQQEFRLFAARLRDVLAVSDLRDRAGSGMFRHAATLARTAISEVHAVMDQRLGDEAGIQRWKYYGPLVVNSRPFCRRLIAQARDGKLWTRDEIAKLDNGQTGPGTAFIARGGFNCNHHWLPIVEQGSDEAVTPTPDEEAGVRLSPEQILATRGPLAFAELGDVPGITLHDDSPGEADLARRLSDMFAAAKNPELSAADRMRSLEMLAEAVHPESGNPALKAVGSDDAARPFFVEAARMGSERANERLWREYGESEQWHPSSVLWDHKKALARASEEMAAAGIDLEPMRELAALDTDALAARLGISTEITEAEVADFARERSYSETDARRVLGIYKANDVKRARRELLGGMMDEVDHAMRLGRLEVPAGVEATATDDAEKIRKGFSAKARTASGRRSERLVKSQIEAIDRTMDRLHPRLLKPEHESISLTYRRGVRAYASKERNVIMLDPREDGRATAAHEFGHHVEFRNRHLLERSKSWRDSRLSGRPLRRLRDLTGNRGYAAREVAVDGGFASPYIGKVYDSDATEVVSMAMQMFEDEELFGSALSDDPEFIRLAWSIARGY